MEISFRERINNKLLDFTFRLYKLINKLYEYNIISDKIFLTLSYRYKKKKWINWRNPHSFSEKLQWLKLYDRKPEYTNIVDKVKFKEWAAKKIDPCYIIPTLFIYDNPEDIKFEKLPNRFVIKCNHSSGKNYIHAADTPLDIKKIKKILNIKFKQNYFKHGGEWPYKNVKKKILVEEYIEIKNKDGIIDYKFYCFNGKPEYIQINSFSDHYIYDREIEIQSFQLFYDKEWNLMEFSQGYPERGEKEISKPENFEKMLEIAAILSQDIPFVRVDMYNVGGKIYVGELTFYPYNGFYPFYPDESWDYKLGELLKLNLKEKFQLR